MKATPKKSTRKPSRKPVSFKPELVAVDQLRPHPRNYRKHPKDELEHIAESIREHGFYRNVVTARDLTILAGHGVVQAAQKIGYTEIPVIRTNLHPNSVRAIKLLIGDNEISHLVENDDRALAGLMKEVLDEDPAKLLGTGWDDMMLANFVMVTRRATEIKDMDEAAAWVGLPDYTSPEQPLTLYLKFETERDRDEAVRRLQLVAVGPVRSPHLKRVLRKWRKAHPQG